MKPGESTDVRDLGVPAFLPLPSIHWHHEDSDGVEVPDGEKCWWISFDVGCDYIDMQLYPDGTFEWFGTNRGGTKGYDGNDRESFANVATCPRFAERMEAIKAGLLAAAKVGT